jgi:hypothetical protein
LGAIHCVTQQEPAINSDRDPACSRPCPV